MTGNGTLGKTINRLRKVKRLSRAKLADAVGCTRQQILNLEKGFTRNPSMKLAQALALALGCTVEELK